MLGSEDLSQTLVSLDILVNEIAENESTARTFVQQVSRASRMLSDERINFRSALRALDRAVTIVAEFAVTNRAQIVDAIGGTSKVFRTMLSRQKQLTEILEVMPLAMQNLTRVVTPGKRAPVRVPPKVLFPFGTRIEQFCERLPDPICELFSGTDPGPAHQPEVGNESADRRTRGHGGQLTPGLWLQHHHPRPADPGHRVSGETITIKADFEEALNLATGATVKINGVDSGRVQEVVANDFQAQAEMLVKEEADLREGATVRLRYTTPLGELFVDVTNPPTGAPLRDGAVLTTDDTDTAPTVEDALSQTSLLVNGGGLAQLQTVTEELNTIVGGREDKVRSLLEGSTSFLTEANATTDDIDLVLRSLASVAKTLRARQQVINRAVREVRPAARVLRRNTPGFTRLLQEVEKFSEVANQTVSLTRTHAAEPDPSGPAGARGVYPQRGEYAVSLRSLVSLGKNVDAIVPADYLSISLALHLDNIAFPAPGETLGSWLASTSRPFAGRAPGPLHRSVRRASKAC